VLRWAWVPRAKQGSTQAGGWLTLDQASRGVDLTLRRAGVDVGGAQRAAAGVAGAGGETMKRRCARTLLSCVVFAPAVLHAIAPGYCSPRPIDWRPRA
jgi:hypothetical protein